VFNRDQLGRLPPGGCRGWGISWWVAEQQLDWRRMSAQERWHEQMRYWDDVRAGWEPDVPRSEWVGDWHPWDPADERPRRDELVAEVRRAAADPADRAECRAVLSDMEAISAPWPDEDAGILPS
jgi:hypothetical protein